MEQDEPSVWEHYRGTYNDEPLVGEHYWGSYDYEPSTATPPAAKRARREEAASSRACGWPPDGAELAPALTVDEPDTFNCGVCFLPLRAPIFQCMVGHMLCSICHDKLKARRKCHVCAIPIPEAGYSRCHGMEHLVECIRIQCPNAAYGCTTRLAYYDQDSHCEACPHAPCHCPGEACSFVGTVDALLDHIADIHGWPCTTTKFNGTSIINLREGFNFLLASSDMDGGEGARTAISTASNQLLFLVNVAWQPLDCVISMLCIGNTDANVIKCRLCFSNNDSINVCHYQTSTFIVACTDLSSGLPDLGKCFRFVVPNSVAQDHEENAIRVQACIMIK